MKHEVNVKWLEGMAFEAMVNGHSLKLDADSEVGGTNLGPRPKPLILAALGGCTGMDVVSMLKKMRVEISAFEMQLEADLADEHPKVYSAIRLVYIFCGNDLEASLDKINKAIEMSQEKYCGVSAMLRKSLTLDYRIELRNS